MFSQTVTQHDIVQKSIVDEHVWMNKVQQISETEFVIYAIKCIKPYVSYGQIVKSKYHGDSREVHQGNYLEIKYLKWMKVLLLVLGGDEEIVVKSYTKYLL